MLQRMASVSPQVHLALASLRLLAGTASGLSLERLASAVAAPPDRLLEVLGPLQHAGWVRREEGPDDLVRYLRPVPPPTLQEVIEAIEGSTPIDDCVLHPGVPCGGLRSAPVCSQHHAWTRQLASSALSVTALAGAGTWTGQGGMTQDRPRQPGLAPGMGDARRPAVPAAHDDESPRDVPGAPTNRTVPASATPRDAARGAAAPSPSVAASEPGVPGTTGSAPGAAGPALPASAPSSVSDVLPC
jgi:DNA-binding IscR family transcriptional regulator